MKVLVKFNDSLMNSGRSTECYENEEVTFDCPDLDSLAVSLESMVYFRNYDAPNDDRDEIIEMFHNEYSGDIKQFAAMLDETATCDCGRVIFYVAIDGKPVYEGDEPVIVFHPGADELRWVGEKHPDGSIEYYEGDSPEDIAYESSLAYLQDRIKKEVESEHKLDIDSFTHDFALWHPKIDGESVTPERVRQVAIKMGLGDSIVDNEKDPAEKMYDIFDKGLSDKPAKDDAE